MTSIFLFVFFCVFFSLANVFLDLFLQVFSLSLLIQKSSSSKFTYEAILKLSRIIRQAALILINLLALLTWAFFGQNWVSILIFIYCLQKWWRFFISLKYEARNGGKKISAKFLCNVK